MDLLLGGIPYLPLTSPGHCSFSHCGRLVKKFRLVQGDRDTATVPSHGLVLGCASDIFFSHSSIWLVIQMNKRLMILRSLFSSPGTAFPPFFRTPDEDRNRRRPLETSSFGISSYTSACCYQRCPVTDPKVMINSIIVVYYVY